MKDDAQMMVLESVIFAITVIIALAFLLQLSPTSIQQSSESITDVKILGDDALMSLSTETFYIREWKQSLRTPTNNPTSQLAVAIITNNYDEIIDTLNNEILPEYTPYFYNIYISNGTKTVFWCSSTGDTDEPVSRTGDEQVAVSHHIIAIDPEHLHMFHEDMYKDGTESDIWQSFQDYEGSTYDVILELWTI